MKKRLDGTRSAPFTRLKLFAHFERINKPGCDHLHWQLLTAVCPLRNYATLLLSQRAKKVLSDSPGLVDFAIGLVNSVFNLPDGQVMFYEEFE